MIMYSEPTGSPGQHTSHVPWDWKTFHSEEFCDSNFAGDTEAYGKGRWIRQPCNDFGTVLDDCFEDVIRPSSFGKFVGCNNIV